MPITQYPDSTVAYSFSLALLTYLPPLPSFPLPPLLPPSPPLLPPSPPLLPPSPPLLPPSPPPSLGAMGVVFLADHDWSWIFIVSIEVIAASGILKGRYVYSIVQGSHIGATWQASASRSRGERVYVKHAPGDITNKPPQVLWPLPAAISNQTTCTLVSIEYATWHNLL